MRKSNECDIRPGNTLIMASEIHMPAPVCLIENIRGQLVANQEALEILAANKNPLVVVAIVGLYRTGKSYLMNKLAGKNKGFSIGTTVQSHTKGIWMWCVPHAKKPNHTLVLLDTEGLGDVEKGDKKNDTQIFALAILLSSIFVYNTMNKIDQRAIDLLHYVTELSNRLRKVSSPDFEGVEDATNLESFCPDFVWILRDFYLTLEVDEQVITADEYLENSLRLKQGTNQSVQNFNLPRLCIKEFFPIRKCFIFDSPTHRKKLAKLESLPNEDLDPEFVEQVATFCSYIFNHSKTKALPGGIKVNGPQNDVMQGIYSKPGGHHLLIQKTELLKARYYWEPRKGMQAEKALQEYLHSRQSTSDAILQIDLALTKRQKEIEEAHMKAMAAKIEAQRLEVIQRYNLQMMEQREWLHQEQVRQMQMFRKYQVQQQQRALERRFQEEAENLNKKIEAEHRSLQNEIQDLQRNAASQDDQDDKCILL
ncbi:guanylate-binding protein 1-like isoform X2 [Eumetopias jubatus]|uniref:guanylate-binding protein 1-like isoform X2 n=1 Tax=Eumetopias jubatus TaxID=34886 RepID=UPI0010166097|nr:guanylate-binding protein 1-like isoform X2 [Eumetopias jubatus]